MPMSAADKDSLKAQLAASRKKALNFGVCIATKPEECALVIDRIKAPEILMKKAKKLGGSAKVACGTVESKGKLVMLTCLEDPPPGAAKRLKAFLKLATGDMMKVQLMDTSGSVLEGDEDEDKAEAAPQDQAQDEPQHDDQDESAELSGKLDAVLKKLAPRIATALGQNAKAQEPIQKLMAAIKTAGAANDSETAKKRLGQLTELLGKIAAAAQKAETAPQAQDEAADEDATEQQHAADEGEQEEAGPVSLVKLGKVRLEWPETRTKAFADLDRLKKHIESEYSDMPEAAGAVSAALSQLDKSLATFNENLHEQLDEVLNADESDRKAQVDAAHDMIKRFNKHVDSDPILAELDGNDILPDVSIAAPIRAKLSEIATALGR
ncbi:hypothetical protein [Ruegeria sp. HKCCD8929]|uniref:hypothetical protein n=1 Tax=Ruegeria sp. HKCCD8929 TaxID=2683006 RepID=UPI001C2C7859|nr:hypothetical protein [Ruegeria sp. HKCCD8929]